MRYVNSKNPLYQRTLNRDTIKYRFGFNYIDLESSHFHVQVKQWQRLKMMVASSGNRRAILLCLGLYLCSGVPFFKIPQFVLFNYYETKVGSKLLLFKLGLQIVLVHIPLSCYRIQCGQLPCQNHSHPGQSLHGTYN